LRDDPGSGRQFGEQRPTKVGIELVGRVERQARRHTVPALAQLAGRLDDGTILTSSISGTLQVVAQTPTGILSNAVSSVDIVFNTAINPLSLASLNVVLSTPTAVPVADITASVTGLDTLRVSFPPQSVPGSYSIQVGPQIQDLFGRTMPQAYVGGFTLALPVIQGTVTDTNGQPVPGVLLQPDSGLPAAMTDASGNYSLNFSSGSTFTVTPSLSGFVFVPGSRGYTNAIASVGGENYGMVPIPAPTLGSVLSDNGLTLNWHGLPRVTYQIYSSTNMVDWEAYGDPFVGSDVDVQVTAPMDGAPQKFFRVQAGN